MAKLDMLDSCQTCNWMRWPLSVWGLHQTTVGKSTRLVWAPAVGVLRDEIRKLGAAAVPLAYIQVLEIFLFCGCFEF